MAKVLRTKTICGTSIPAIIHNQHYFLTDIDIFEDGAIWCWGTTDLNLFREKLQKGWVTTSIPDDKAISVHGLGCWVVKNGEWFCDSKSFYRRVYDALKKLNPELRNLYQHYEKKVNGVVRGEWGEGTVFRSVPRTENDPFPLQEKGESLRVFYKSRDVLFLTDMAIFANGEIELNGLSDGPGRIDLDTLYELVEHGTIITEPLKGSVVEIGTLGRFSVGDPHYVVSIENKLLEIQDVIHKLNGASTSRERCRKIYEEYLDAPTIELKRALKIAYEEIPAHQRHYLGDMDTKDIPVRMIIYGEDEIENWSHRIASRKMGIELPTINIPKLENE